MFSDFGVQGELVKEVLDLLLRHHSNTVLCTVLDVAKLYVQEGLCVHDLTLEKVAGTSICFSDEWRVVNCSYSS